MSRLKEWTEDNWRLSDCRRRQRKIRFERAELMNKAAELTEEWHQLENECRQIENDRPLSETALALLAKNPNLRARPSGHGMLSCHHLKYFWINKNHIHLLFALETAIAHGEPVPEVCGEWIKDAVSRYKIELLYMQEGKATPCIAELLSIPPPSDAQAVTKPIKKYFDELRDEQIKSDIAFLMTCFKSMKYKEAAEIILEHGRHVPRGPRNTLSDSFKSADSMRRTLGSGKNIKNEHGLKFRKLNKVQVTEHMNRLNIVPQKKRELIRRILVPVSRN